MLRGRMLREGLLMLNGIHRKRQTLWEAFKGYLVLAVAPSPTMSFLVVASAPHRQVATLSLGI